ncbi:MAG: TadE/TadG family type IV pilus assembly protein, partial [Anaerolineales bacterium]|nr:TadE/TadG family type IV pilus assembly protein [Anaerolineales bacterium]
MHTFLNLLKHLHRPGRAKSRGQSLLELAIFLPLLLMLLGGLIEFGFALNEYVNLVEATREAARFGVDQDPGERNLIPYGTGPNPRMVSNAQCREDGLDVDDVDADGIVSETIPVTTDFYARVACRLQAAAAPLTFNRATDDILITVVAAYRDERCSPQFTATPPPIVPDCRSYIMPQPTGIQPMFTPRPGIDPPQGRAGSPSPRDIGGVWQRYGN